MFEAQLRKGDQADRRSRRHNSGMTPDAEMDWRERIERARRLIESRLDEEVPLDDLAAAACASVYHFHRVFRGLTGETVREYARRLRLERAAHRLTHGREDILTIALQSGYDSHEAFTRAFKRHFGASPSEFRSEERAARTPTEDSAMKQSIDVRIEEFPRRRIAFVRHVGPYDGVGQAWGALMKWGWFRMFFGKAATFGLCYDDPDVTPAERLRYEACMVVSAKTRPKHPVEIREMPAMTCAVALHAGPLNEIGETYARLFAHVAAEPIAGRRWLLGDPPSLERYLCDPRKVKPEDMRTEICMPVTPAAAAARIPT